MQLVRSKIVSIDKVPNYWVRRYQYCQKIVQCHGVFDLLHIGHIRHFEQAKAMGDLLIVTVTADQWVNKGSDRPRFTQEERAEAIAALDCVDYVVINDHTTADEAINILKPDIFVKGPDYQDQPVSELAAVEKIGGTLAFTNGTKYSSTELLQERLPSNTGSTDVTKYLDGAKDLKILVVGEAIIDEYVYCDVLGKAGKEPVLVGKELRTESYIGGTQAIGKHLATFSDYVTTTVTGPIIKRRFIDERSGQKLFELYDVESVEPCSLMPFVGRYSLEDFDLVIVSDYGHGMIDSDTVEVLCSKAKFLAVNCQLNAGNRGFHTISKYPRADLVCISEQELRLDARDRNSHLDKLMVQVGDRYPQIIVTRGALGCMAYAHDMFSTIPAFTTDVVDRIGAGDAVLALSAMCAAQGAPLSISATVGNAAGAAAVGIVGNSASVDRLTLERYLGIAQ